MMNRRCFSLAEIGHFLFCGLLWLLLGGDSWIEIICYGLLLSRRFVFTVGQRTILYKLLQSTDIIIDSFISALRSELTFRFPLLVSSIFASSCINQRSTAIPRCLILVCKGSEMMSEKPRSRRHQRLVLTHQLRKGLIKLLLLRQFLLCLKLLGYFVKYLLFLTFLVVN